MTLMNLGTRGILKMSHILEEHTSLLRRWTTKQKQHSNLAKSPYSLSGFCMQQLEVVALSS